MQTSARAERDEGGERVVGEGPCSSAFFPTRIDGGAQIFVVVEASHQAPSNICLVVCKERRIKDPPAVHGRLGSQWIQKSVRCLDSAHTFHPALEWDY